MQSSLWKLGALLGVIGIGFLVLLEAQKGMTVNPGADPADEFGEAAAIDELGNLGDENSADGDRRGDGSVDDNGVSRFAFAQTDRSEANAAGVSASPAIEPTPAMEFEPGTALGPDPTSALSDDAAPPAAADEEQDNPFAAFSFAAAPDAPPQSEPLADPAPEPSPAEPERSNPFANLVNSFTDDSTVPDDSATPDISESPDREFAGTTDTVSGPFNPFANGPETEPDAEAEGEPDMPEAVSSAAIFPQEDESAPLPGLAPEEPKPEPRTALPADHPGPVLMSPPSFKLGEPSPEETADTQLPAQQAEPAVYERVSEVGNTETPVLSEIVQVGAEQPVDAGNEPNPFLVFPGAENVSEPSGPAPAASANATPPAAMPSVEPEGTSGRAWVGDDTSELNPQGERVHQDGTIEMTIKPRGKGEQHIVPPQTAGRSNAPAAGEFNPFESVPEASASTPANVPDDPTLLPDTASYPDRSIRPRSRLVSPEQPTFQGLIRPSNAEVPASGPSPAHSLTPADYIGVGTVSADTPSTQQQAQLTIEKQAPNDAVLGQDLIYSILVKNIGRSPAQNVVVEDLVPKGSELKGTDPQAQMTPDKKLVWQLGTMEPRAERTIRIKVVPIRAGQIGSVATVSFEAAVASRTIITAPELRLEMQGPREVRVGETAPYVFKLTNVGSADASNVYIRSILPSGFRHPAANEDNDIEYEVGLLKRGQSRQIELTLLAVSAGRFQNHAILSADGDVSVESHQPVNVIPSRLKIRREGPTNRFVGREARFISTLTNESSETLHNVLVTETVPSGVKLVEASDAGSFDAQQRTVTWRIETLEPGGARRLQTVVLADQPGRLESTINARDERGDAAEAVSQMTVVGFSSLTVDMANPGRPIPVGEELALRLKIRNGGTAAANQVRTSIELPPELRFISVRGPVSYSQQGRRIVFEAINHIDVGAEQNFDIVLAAAQASDDARVVVQLSSSELVKPLNEEESVVIFAEGE